MQQAFHSNTAPPPPAQSSWSAFLIFGGIGIALEAISIAINHDFARSMVANIWAAQLYGAAFVAVDVVKVVLFSELAIVAGQGRRGRLFGYFLFWLAASVVSMYAAAGFASKNFGDTVASRGHAQQTAAGVTADLARARADLDALPRTRPAAVIATERNEAAGRISPKLWKATKECTDTQPKGATAACKKFLDLKAQEAQAEARATAEKRVADLAARQAQAPSVGSADPAAEAIQRHSAGAIPAPLTAAVQFWLIVTVIPFGGSICVGIAREKVRHVTWSRRHVTSDPVTTDEATPSRDILALSRDTTAGSHVTPRPESRRKATPSRDKAKTSRDKGDPKSEAERQRDSRARKRRTESVKLAAAEAGKLVSLSRSRDQVAAQEQDEPPAQAAARE